MMMIEIIAHCTMKALSLSLLLLVLVSVLWHSTSGFLLIVPSEISRASSSSRRRGGGGGVGDGVCGSVSDKSTNCNNRGHIFATATSKTARRMANSNSNNHTDSDIDVEFDFGLLDHDAHDDDKKTNPLTKQFWFARWEAADILEIRLDATLVTCHVLARFLCYDLTLPAKDVPGLNVADVVALLHTFSSAALLCLLWTAAGLIVRLFENVHDFAKIAETVLLAAPIWILLEQMLGWSYTPATVSMQTGYMTSLDVMLEQVILGAVGLLATMTLSRLVPKMLR